MHTTIRGAVWGLLLVGYMASVVEAQTWLNPASGDWFNGANWSGGAPTPGSTPQFIDDPGTYTVSFTSSPYGPTYYNSYFYGYGSSSGGATNLTLDLNGFTSQPYYSGGVGYQVLYETYIGYGSRTLNLTLQDGVMTSRTGVYVGYSGGTGAMRVDGATWNILGGGPIYLGYSGSGAINIVNGGRVSFQTLYGNSPIYLAYNTTTDSGSIIVDGPGSRFDYSGSNAVYVGTNGTGALQVTNGGVFAAPSAVFYVGTNSSSASGDVLVDGAGSSLSVRDVYVGNSSRSSRINVNGGSMAVANYTRVNQGGVLRVQGGTFTTPQLELQGTVESAGGLISVGTTATLNTSLSLLKMQGGTFQAATQLSLSSGAIEGYGAVSSPLIGQSSAAIRATGGLLSIGRAGATNGFDHAGMISVSSGAQLELLDANEAQLGSRTTLTNGVLIARNHAFLGSGEILEGYGIVIGQINGTGTNTLATAPTGTVQMGFGFGAETARVYSVGPAQLGGSTIAGGTVIATNGIHLDEAGMTGRGTLQGNVTLDNGLLHAQGGVLSVVGPISGNGIVLIAPGSSISAASLTAVGSLDWSGALNIGAGGATVVSQGMAQLGSSTTLAGGGLVATQGVAIGVGEAISGFGNVSGAVLGGAGSTITASGGALYLGDAASFSGFSTAGALNVGADDVTLSSRGFAGLNGATSLAGGTIIAVNGVSLGAGASLSGTGFVTGRVAASLGSVIEATGNLVMGDSSSFAGFASAGELRVGANNVTIEDRNQADLGSLVTIAGGTLTAANGGFVDFAAAITGYGTVGSVNNAAKAFVNNGSIVGNSSAERITMTGYVKGVGMFDEVNFTGTFSPGLSPAEVEVGSIALDPGATLLMELGGTTAGSQYDKLNISGTAELDGTLEVAFINGFNPSGGEEFDLFDGNLSGTFDTVNLPTLAAGMFWNTDQLYSAGLIIIAVPEPSTTALLLGVVGWAAGAFWRRRRAAAKRTAAEMQLAG